MSVWTKSLRSSLHWISVSTWRDLTGLLRPTRIWACSSLQLQRNLKMRSHTFQTLTSLHVRLSHAPFKDVGNRLIRWTSIFAKRFRKLICPSIATILFLLFQNLSVKSTPLWILTASLNRWLAQTFFHHKKTRPDRSIKLFQLSPPWSPRTTRELLPWNMSTTGKLFFDRC